jgi:hypothetical protein
MKLLAMLDVRRAVETVCALKDPSRARMNAKNVAIIDGKNVDEKTSFAKCA